MNYLLFFSRVSQDRQDFQDHWYVDTFSNACHGVSVVWLMLLLFFFLFFFRVNLVLLASLEERVLQGWKVKKWVQLMLIAISKDTFVLKLTPSKGQWRSSRLSGTNGTTGLTRVTRTDGTRTHLHIMYVWPVPTHVWTGVSSAQWKGPPGIEGLDGKDGKPGLRVSSMLHLMGLPTHHRDGIQYLSEK